MNFNDNRFCDHQSIYKKLMQLIPGLEQHIAPAEGVIRSRVEGRQDLMYSYVQKDSDGHHCISLAQEINCEGSPAPDPEMLIRVIPEQQFAEALTFLNRFVYHRVYDEYEDEPFVHIKHKYDLNEYLSNWLSTLIIHGHNIELGAQRINEHRGQRATNRNRTIDRGSSSECDIER